MIQSAYEKAFGPEWTDRRSTVADTAKEHVALVNDFDKYSTLRNGDVHVPSDFKTWCGEHQMPFGAHQDAAEFFQKFGYLNTLVGGFTALRKWHTNEEDGQVHQSVHKENFVLRIAEIPDQQDPWLLQVGQRSPEPMTGANQWECWKCKMQVDAYSQEISTIQTLPVLVHLKRFRPEFQEGQEELVMRKVHTPVRIPPKLTIGDWVYRFCGCILHSGTVRSGHYTARVLAKNRKWFNCDDGTITDLTAEEALKSPTAFLIMYEQLERAPVPQPISLDPPQ